MTTELSMLLFSGLLFFAIIIVQASLAVSQNGLPAQGGSRDNLPEPTLLRKRFGRLIANFQENLLLFAIVVGVAHMAGVNNDTTALGASIFFYARIGHAIVYAFGWPWIRPLVWFVSVVGIFMIVSQLI